MLCPQYSCEVGFQPRCDKGEDVILPLVTSQFCSQEVRRGDRWVTVQVKPKCENNKLVTMVREDRGFTCRRPSGTIHRPGGQPQGVRSLKKLQRLKKCKEGDPLCEEFRDKCYWMYTGCGLIGGWSNALIKAIVANGEKNNRIVVNDMKEYLKERRERQGLD